MIGLGDKLRSMRLGKGISIADVEQTTKIRSKYIEALENEEFNVLPGKVYVKGFIKTYARFLELEDKELIELYETSLPKEQEIKQQSVKKHSHNQPKGFNKKYMTVLLSIIAILTLVGLQHVYVSFTENQVPPPNPSVEIENNLPNGNEDIKQGEEEDTDEEEQIVIDKLVLTIEISEQSCWVRVYGDGNIIVFEKTMKTGEKTVIEADETIRVTLGNAGVTRLNLNGEDLGVPGNKGQVVDKKFNIEDYL